MSRRRQRAGRQVVDAAGVTGAVGHFIHEAEGQFFTAGIHAETHALGLNKRAGEFRQRAKGWLACSGGEAAGEGGRPATQMFAEEFLLRVAALGELVSVELMFKCVGFLGGKHAEKFEFEADVILALAGVLGHLQTECTVECREVGEAMRLEERVGLDVAVFDFVEWAAAARGVAEGGKIGVEK